MNNIISFQQYKYKKQVEHFGSSVYSFFTTIFDLFLRYVAYPMIAAVATMKRGRVVVA